MGKLDGLNNAYIRGFLEALEKNLDEAYSRGDPIIIVELGALDQNPELRLAVEIFVTRYVQDKRTRRAYLESKN